MTRRRIVLNGRFLAMPVTGVQRYARQLARHRLGRCADEISVIVPPGRRLPLTDDVPNVTPGRRVSGVAGHWWEQARLPRLVGSDELLVSLANWGPVAVSAQVVAILDTAPFRVPRAYSPGYRLAVRGLQRRLAHRAQRIVTLSEEMRTDLVQVLDVKPDRVDVVPPGVASGFFAEDILAPDRRRHFVFVGMHDTRKNLSFLLDLWGEVHAATGCELHVVGRSHSRPHRQSGSVAGSGVMVHVDAEDDALLRLYRRAHAVLAPSSFEGFGLALLEGMAAGTPFLATNTGAAAELAVEPDAQVLPLQRRIWIERLVDWAGADLSDLARRGRELARRYTWEESARRLGEAIGRAAEEQR